MEAIIVFTVVSVVTSVLCAVFDRDKINPCNKFFKKLMKKNEKKGG